VTWLWSAFEPYGRFFLTSRSRAWFLSLISMPGQHHETPKAYVRVGFVSTYELLVGYREYRRLHFGMVSCNETNCEQAGHRLSFTRASGNLNPVNALEGHYWEATIRYKEVGESPI
jgi:putative hemolysin